MSAKNRTFEEFVDEVEQSVREYVSHENPQWRKTTHVRAKHLDLDEPTPYIGRALSQLRDDGVVEETNAVESGASVWRLVRTHNRIPTADLMQEIARLAGELGRTPRKEDMVAHGKYDYTTYNDRMGWNTALEAVGLTPNTRGPQESHPNTIPKSVVAADYQRVADELGRVPSASDLDEHAEVSSATVKRKFDSLSKAAEDVLGVPSQ